MVEKFQHRNEMITRRLEISASQKNDACGYLCEKLLGLSLPPEQIIAGYMPMRGEVDITPALGTFCARGYVVCLPKMQLNTKILSFLPWRPDSLLTAGKYGVFEPEGGEALLPDVVLVPLVAFDRRGYRVGYGGGYYDATLAYLKQAKPQLQAIGIAYGFQEVPEIQHEAHDVRLDTIVTEKEIITP